MQDELYAEPLWLSHSDFFEDAELFLYFPGVVFFKPLAEHWALADGYAMIEA